MQLLMRAGFFSVRIQLLSIHLSAKLAYSIVMRVGRKDGKNDKPNSSSHSQFKSENQDMRRCPHPYRNPHTPSKLPTLRSIRCPWHLVQLTYCISVYQSPFAFCSYTSLGPYNSTTTAMM